MPLIPETIPEGMQRYPNWVVWKYITRGGKPTKVPFDPKDTNFKAKANDPATWGTFERALSVYRAGGWEGIGFQFTGTDLTGVDFDHKKWGPGVHPIAEDALTRLDTYSEMTPSGMGQHAILCGKLPEWATNRKQIAEDLEVEIYSEGRFFTVTGDVIVSPFVESRQEVLEALLIEWGMVKAVPLTREASTGSAGAFTGSDSELWERIWRSTNGQAVRALADGDLTQYGGDRSRADFALCGHLCFWTNGDAGRMDTMFRTSGLMRPKWDAKHRSDGTTYGQMTIQEVLARWDGKGYDPTQKEKPRATIKEEWSSPDVLMRGRQHLASSGSHGRTVNSYSTLWHALVHVITSGYTRQEGDTLTVTPFGMTELYAQAGGRPVDRRQQLGFLHEQGMCGPLVRHEPDNPRSAWLVTVPSNPADLPMSTAPRGSLPALPLNRLNRPPRGKARGGVTDVIKGYESINVESRFFAVPDAQNNLLPKGQHLPVWTLFSLSILTTASSLEVADLCGLTRRVVTQHLAAHPTLADPLGHTKARRWKSVLTPEQVGTLYLQITAPQVAHRRRKMLEARRDFHESKFEYLTAHGLFKQAAIHYDYWQRYERHLREAA